MALAEKIHEGLRKHQEKSKAREEKKSKEKKESKKKGKHHFRVEEMDDGSYTVHHRVVPHGKGEYMEPSHEETSTHKSMGHVTKHMKECCEDEPDTGIVAGEEKPNPKSQNRLN